MLNRKLVPALLFAVFMSWGWNHASATVTLTWGAQDVTLSDATTKIPVGALWVLVADTANNGFGAVTNYNGVGTSLDVGGAPTIQADDLVLKRGAVDASDGAGMINFGAVLIGTLGSPASWSAGNPLALFWFPTFTTNDNATSGGSYGMYTTNAALNGGLAWVTPSDGSTVSLSPLITSSAGGSQPNSLGAANLTVLGTIPEPSSVASLVLGLGALTLFLRRRPAKSGR